MVGRLLAEAGGRRPVCFGTPFEAAVWAVLSQRVSMAQAGRVKDALAASLGTPMEIGGVEVLALPGPAALVELESFEGVWDSKLERIRALAAVALAGDLDPAFLRARLDLDEALAHLQALPGIGPFGAMPSSRAAPATPTSHPDPPPLPRGSPRGLRPRRGARRGEARGAQRGLAALPGLGDLAAAEHGGE